MLTQEQYGEVRPDGKRTQPALCAITGKPLDSGDVFLHMADSPFTVGVKAAKWNRLSPAMRADVKAELFRRLPKPSEADEAGPPAVSELDTLSFEDLKALAKEEGIETTGLRSAKDYAGAIRANRALRSLADAPLGGAE